MHSNLLGSSLKWPIQNESATKCFPCFAEVAEELCKTASCGKSGVVHSFSHDQPLVPSKSRPQKKHSDNKDNMEGLESRHEPGAHGPSGTPADLHFTRLQRRLKRMGVVFLLD